MNYFLYRKQYNEGCDYTIGCGMSFKKLNATTKEKAIKEIICLEESWKENIIKKAIEKKCSIEDYINDYIVCGSGLSYLNEGGGLEDCLLLEVADEINMLPILIDLQKEVENFKLDMMAQSSEKGERQQYENLKKKYG